MSEEEPPPEVVPLSVEVTLSDDVFVSELELFDNISLSSDSSELQEMKVRAMNIARQIRFFFPSDHLMRKMNVDNKYVDANSSLICRFYSAAHCLMLSREREP